MRYASRGRLRLLAVVAVVAAALAGVAVPASAADPSAGVMIIPPAAVPYGASYAEWSAAWFQWAFSLPATGHPLLQSGHVACSAGQSGRVWFLGGSFAPGPIARSCTIPPRHALFLPVLNNASLALPREPTSPRRLRHNTRGFFAPATGVRMSIDGRRVPHLGRFLVESTFFMVRLGEDNLFGLSPGELLRGVGIGYWIMLAPPPPGRHRLRLRGTLGDFSLDVTYHLRVLPGSTPSFTLFGPAPLRFP
jgi:hypothetical protein